MYYITIVTQNRKSLFGTVENNEMFLSPFGKTVYRHWKLLFHRYPRIRIDEFIVMPDHVHGIIEIRDLPVGVGFADVAKPTPTAKRHHGIPEIVRGFKTATATAINIDRKTPGVSVWQRNYYERVIRDDVELIRTRQYIRDNPKNWNQF